MSASQLKMVEQELQLQQRNSQVRKVYMRVQVCSIHEHRRTDGRIIEHAEDDSDRSAQISVQRTAWCPRSTETSSEPRGCQSTASTAAECSFERQRSGRPLAALHTNSEPSCRAMSDECSIAFCSAELTSATYELERAEMQKPCWRLARAQCTPWSLQRRTRRRGRSWRGCSPRPL